MKVLLLSRYGPLGASSRVRFLQYLPYLESQGIQVTVKPLFSDSYLRALYSGGSRISEVLKGYLVRAWVLFSAHRFDVVIIEKELFPFMPAIAERLLKLMGVRYLVDYDDALFHRYDCHSNILMRKMFGRKIDAVMRSASYVTVGNTYLAERAKMAGAKNIEIIPTVIDSAKYLPASKGQDDTLIVGWIGTPQTSRYLKSLLSVFKGLHNEFPVRFVAVGANPEDFEGSPIEVWPWSEDSEVSSIQRFDIGIMPLVDSPWERGKCGYKLIQYMACGLPVVASPVGVNNEIVGTGVTGYLARSSDDWQVALTRLKNLSRDERLEMGAKGREFVERWYCLEAQSPRLLKILNKLSGKRSFHRDSPF